MTSTLIFGQNVYLSGEFGMALYSAWFSTDTVLFRYLFSGHHEAEHRCYHQPEPHPEVYGTSRYQLQQSYGSPLDTNDLNSIVQMQSTTLYSTSSNSTTTSNGEYVLNWHQERLVSMHDCGSGIVASTAIHKLHDLVSPRSHRIFQSLQSRTSDNGWSSPWNPYSFNSCSDLHLNQLKKLSSSYHITFVQEYNDVRNAYLTGQKDVLFSLSHNTIGSSYYRIAPSICAAPVIMFFT